MTLPPDHDPLGPERNSPDSPRGSNADDASARPRLSRIEEEVERLRRSPTPTRDGGRSVKSCMPSTVSIIEYMVSSMAMSR